MITIIIETTAVPTPAAIGATFDNPPSTFAFALISLLIIGVTVILVLVVNTMLVVALFVISYIYKAYTLQILFDSTYL